MTRLKFNRKKARQPLLSLIYRFSKLPFASRKKKLKLFLRLHWIFWRLNIEQAEKVFRLEENPARMKSLEFLLGKMEPDFTVVDMGCKYGDISALIAQKTKSVLGIDHDADAITVAKECHSEKNLSFLLSDAEDYLEKQKENFDVVILSHFIEQLEVPEDFLRKAKSHFRFFYFEIPDFDDSAMNHYRKALDETLLYTDNADLWVFDRDSLREMIVSCGLEVIEEEFRYGVLKFWCRNPQ
jgi:2-polyprenyl-3-methyl-5-hydroxy-6-metoxy-1,4-benzoquinol methylase